MFSFCCSRDKKKYELLSPEEKRIERDIEQNSKEFKLLEKYEKDVLKFSGLVESQYEIKNVYIDQAESIWIHTQIYGLNEKNKDQIPYVMIHGYGHTGICFYQIISSLLTQRPIYCIDLLGMGLSKRQEFEYEKPEEILDFFNNSIEQWRKAIGLQQFILVGHSIGGYIGANYAMHHKQNVKNLHLISPIGGTYYTEQQNLEYEVQRKERMGFWMKRLYNNVIKPGWENQATPESILQKFYMPMNRIVKRYVQNRLKLSGDEFEAYKNYLYQMYSFKPSSSKCLHKLFRFPKLSAFISLDKEMPKYYTDQPVHFYFGDDDWMNQKGAKHMVEQKILQKSTFSVINNAGHNVQFDNGKQLVQRMIENDKKYL